MNKKCYYAITEDDHYNEEYYNDTDKDTKTRADELFDMFVDIWCETNWHPLVMFNAFTSLYIDFLNSGDDYAMAALYDWLYATINYFNEEIQTGNDENGMFRCQIEFLKTLYDTYSKKVSEIEIGQ